VGTAWLVPLPVAVALAALGGALIASGVLPWVRAPSRHTQTVTEQFDAMAGALMEGVLDLYSLYEVAGTVSASLHVDQLLTTTMKRVAETTGIESYGLFVVDELKNALVPKGIGGSLAQGLPRTGLPLEDGLAGRVVASRLPQRCRAPEASGWPDVPAAARAACAVPLLGRHRVLGALILYSGSPAAFENPGQVAYFAAVGKQIGIALDNAAHLGRVTELSYRDGLTSLFNRRYLEEALENEVRRAARYGQPLSLQLLDIDHFKTYNDTFGHTAGDEALRLVAQRLREHYRDSDILTRYGGEEFAVILPTTTKWQARLVAEKIRETIAATSGEALSGSGAAVTISVGVAAFPDDAATALGLLRAADAALYAAKGRGRNRVEVFSRQ
jgi:diguanylate cyclase (GGDEF)-like protein